MKTKAKLIQLAKSLGVRGEDESFYRFACTYLFGMKRRGKSDVSEFYEVLNLGERNAVAVRTHFGITGNKRDEDISDWCRLILGYRSIYFADLSLDELRQLMGYCAYEAKVKKALSGNTSQYHQSNNKPYKKRY